MVFSAPRLVFVVCVTLSLVFGISCSYLFSMSFLPFGIVLVLYFAFSILCGPCFSVCLLLRISCSLLHFYSRSLLLTFSFPQLVCSFTRFEQCVVISWLSVLCSCYQSGRSGAGSSKLCPILCLWRGSWIGLVGGSPFPPFFFSSFRLKLSHGVYVRCLRGNLFPIISLLGTV